MLFKEGHVYLLKAPFVPTDCMYAKIAYKMEPNECINLVVVDALPCDALGVVAEGYEQGVPIQIHQFVPVPELSAREWLIELCAQKQRMIGPDHRYFTAEDRQELENDWSESRCRRVKSRIQLSVKSNDISDTNICPWCVWHSCSTCAYGVRHGNCNVYGSDYNKLETNITAWPGFTAIKDWIIYGVL